METITLFLKLFFIEIKSKKFSLLKSGNIFKVNNVVATPDP